MPRSRRAEAGDWIAHAETDLRAAAAVLAIEPPILGDALFHAQQAVEKALKALLVAHGVRFRATHDLRELSGLVLTFAPDLEPRLKSVVRLAPYAVTFRYPGYYGVPPVEEVRADLALAREVVALLRERVEASAADD